MKGGKKTTVELWSQSQLDGNGWGDEEKVCSPPKKTHFSP